MCISFKARKKLLLEIQHAHRVATIYCGTVHLRKHEEQQGDLVVNKVMQSHNRYEQKNLKKKQ